MSTRRYEFSPRASLAGYQIGRRGLLKAGAVAAGAAALGLTMGNRFASAQLDLGSATGDLSFGSNYSNDVPKAGLQAAIDALPNENVTVNINTVDHNTFQENITTYLQNPDDVISWFAGYRMQYFADQDLLGPIDDVWGQGLNETMSEGFKLASTGHDGLLYFVPFNYYAWGIYYRPSIFEANGWTPPTTLDELKALAEAMQTAGITPFAFGNDGRWPAMGTFDQINFRLNGYQFHMDLMAGLESWTDDRVKNVFQMWTEFLPWHQENPNGRTWEEAASTIVDGTSGMMTIGTFIGQQFPDADTSDLDFFVWPELNPEFGIGTVEAPIDGFLMAKNPKNPEAAKELLYHMGTAAGQDAYLAVDPSAVATANDVDTSGYSPLQLKVLEAVSSAPSVTQFLDRDTSPEFASNVAGQAFADFLADPGSIDGILEDMQAQAEVIFEQ
ncbi:MAG: ABC transporter substrate-binding protein [Thermomicrobiales bacterium]|nr:ABC transporter substrate-binding protein [Thermomicrobiales bacterium]